MGSELRDVDHGWADLMRRAKELSHGVHVKVGVLADSERGGLHHQDADGKAEPLTVAEIAVVNEFGTQDGHTPARPAFRNTFDRTREELVAEGRRLVVRMLLAGMPTEKALDVLGLKLATEIRKTITTGDQVPPPNAPSTAARKASRSRGKKARAAGLGVRTLVDTARMVGAIAWARVIEGKQDEARYVSSRR